MSYLRFNVKKTIKENFSGTNILADSLNNIRNFDADRLVVIDSLRVDEHMRLTITKKVKAILPLMVGDTIIVSQDRYNKELLFNIQRHSNIVDTWVVRRRDPTTIVKNTNSKKTVKTYQEQLGEINKSRSQDAGTNCYSDNKGNNNNDTHILLIDDEEDLLTVYKLFLSSAGYTNLKAFSDPREGLKHVVDLKDPCYYNLAILDIRMGGINGMQLYQMLKIVHPNIKALFVSALDAAEEIITFFPGLKPSDFIRKPIEQEHFIKRVKETLFYSTTIAFMTLIETMTLICNFS
jgi:CheY-like chemotaxis protein